MGRRGPALSGVCLEKTIDFPQTRGRAGLPTRRSVHVVKALRSPTQLAMARGWWDYEALMGDTVYTVYSGTAYFVQIVYFRTSKMHTCPLRVSVHCVLCIAYSAANLYSHLKKGLCT